VIGVRVACVMARESDAQSAGELVHFTRLEVLSYFDHIFAVIDLSDTFFQAFSLLILRLVFATESRPMTFIDSLTRLCK